MTIIIVCAPHLNSTGGTVILPDGIRKPCLLGKHGLIPASEKREGDGKTPLGCYPLRRLFYRPDRLSLPQTELECIALTPEDRWCDDPEHPDYNLWCKHPHPARCETLWREDRLYDIFVEVGYNDSPPLSGHGSAIFLHQSHPNNTPTQGCVALSPDDLRFILKMCTQGDTLMITVDSSL